MGEGFNNQQERARKERGGISRELRRNGKNAQEKRGVERWGSSKKSHEEKGASADLQEWTGRRSARTIGAPER